METNANKVALVTGAARGIGRGCAEALAGKGFDLVLNDREMSADLEAAVAGVEAAGRRAVALPGDIAEVEDHERFVTEAWAAFGRLDCLVNNAGISVARRDDLLKVTPESFDRLIAVNLRGTFFLTQAVAKRMLEEEADGFRSIVTISSANAVAASTERGEYCLSKIGLSMLTKLFAVRLAAGGVHVYEVRPGVIRTDMTAVARERYDRLFAEGFTPINRWGEPGDVGTTVATLAAGAFPYTTGEAVHVDGGLLITRF